MTRAGQIFFLCLISSFARGQDLDWVKSFSADSFFRVSRIVTTSGDDLIILGDGLGKSNELSDGNYRGSTNWYGALAKYDAKGQLIWNLIPMSDTYVFIYECKVDAEENIHLIGTFSDRIIIRSDTFTADGRVSFAAKLDADGNVMWMRKMQGIWIYGLQFLSGDILYRWRSQETEASIETGFGVDKYPLEYAYNFGFAKFSSNGQMIWIKHFGGDDYYLGLEDWETDENAIYLLLSPEGSFDIAPGPGKTTITGPEQFYHRSIYFVKYDKNGNLIWVKTIHELPASKIGEIIHGLNFDINKDGDFVFTGNFNGKVDFDFSAKEYFLGSDDWHNYYHFLGVYDSSLAIKWAHALYRGRNNTGYLSLYSSLYVKVHEESIFLSGMYDQGTDLDPGPGIYAPPNSQNHFFAEYSKHGKFLSARIFGEKNPGHYNTGLTGFAIDKHLNIYLSGASVPGNRFDLDPSTDTVFFDYTGNRRASFVARYQYCKKPVEIIPIRQSGTCGEKVTSLFAMNNHYPITWYDISGNELYQGVTYSLPELNNPIVFVAQDGCGYRDTIKIDRQNRWAHIEKIYPNPASSKVSISLESTSSQEVNIQLINLLGQVVRTGTYSLTDGYQILTVPVENLKRGIYYLTLSNECFSYSEKVAVTVKDY